MAELIESMGMERYALDKVLKRLGIPEVRGLDDYNLILLSSALLAELALRNKYGGFFENRISKAYDVMVKWLLKNKPLPRPLEPARDDDVPYGY